MTIRLIAPERKRNYFEAAFSGVLAVLEAIGPTGPNIPNILANLKAGFSHLKGLNEDEPAHRAWVWAYKTISYAAGDMLKAQQINAPLSISKDEAVREFIEAATRFEDLELDILALTNPAASNIFENSKKALAAFLLKATTGADFGVDSLGERFNQALRLGSYRTLCEDPVYFRVLEEGLTGLAGEGARRDGYWARHANWISHQYTDTPIFSPDENEIIPLESVYLPPRCFWHQIKNIENSDDTQSVHKAAHIADLSRTIHEWLSKIDRSDTVRVVTGGPGSGKSSFARALAHELIRRGKHRVLFLQLQHMTLTGSLYDDIARYVDRRDTATGQFGSPGLPGNPLDWRKTDEMPIIMIFDGLDELSTKEDDGERYARELLLALKLMLSPLNADGSPIRALVLGRNVACQSAMAAANIPLEYMLNVAPISKIDDATCMALNGSRTMILDPENLKNIDQREQYWKNWANLKGLNKDVTPNAILSASMRDLNSEPLLLHLLIISKYSGEDWELAAQNKNVVYEDILQKIFERNRHKEHFLAAGVDEALFFEFMECLGIAAWRGNGRTGDESEFRQIRKLHLNKEKKFKDFPAASLKSVALNIHTRAAQDDLSGGFEFIHKSFGEYLAARGLLFHALKTAHALREKDPEDIEQQWCQLIGFAELTPEIISFLYGEARLKLTEEQAIEYKDALTELLNWALLYGFSVQKIAADAPWADLARQQRCALSALVASTSAIATAIPVGNWIEATLDAPWTVNVRWEKNGIDAAKEKLNEIALSTERPAIKALRRINLADQRLWDSSLSRINMEGADLRCTILIWSILIDSYLDNANLSALQASHTRFFSTSLRGCDLSTSDFEQATFQGVDMRQCNLRGASLAGVDASYKDRFRFGNSFTGLLVNGSIDMDGADLTGADISDADLSGVINLSLDAVNSAIGTPETKLPSYIDRNQVGWLRKSKKKTKSNALPEVPSLNIRIHRERHKVRLDREAKRNSGS
ncbi:hypothetical protein J2045_004655 [Peteryoungia aggregata LMG 23059]|uniref:NACHT domain-containing protein n=1 Tax=Peteryoungia aggregata LMG 23059 TaxID=1368425 RepID=A0ABU0GE12_9HYPH|nr:pentapeptide repeat-containing protein [Peteryoungia aggregata]MDQ0423600.1 hypothetical protein [Peteryoungia aggregata LMG 23059]